MYWMRETQREVEKMVGTPEEIEISAETAAIADAIYAGLARIAEAIEYHGRVSAGDETSEDDSPKHYIDGTPMR